MLLDLESRWPRPPQIFVMQCERPSTCSMMLGASDGGREQVELGIKLSSEEGASRAHSAIRVEGIVNHSTPAKRDLHVLCCTCFSIDCNSTSMR